jgi:hypothetical protein
MSFVIHFRSGRLLVEHEQGVPSRWMLHVAGTTTARRLRATLTVLTTVWDETELAAVKQ